jgi:hypothetical protein
MAKIVLVPSPFAPGDGDADRSQRLTAAADAVNSLYCETGNRGYSGGSHSVEALSRCQGQGRHASEPLALRPLCLENVWAQIFPENNFVT